MFTFSDLQIAQASNASALDSFTTASYSGDQDLASLADIVWNDQNGNGMLDTYESGISGVTVWVDLNNNSLPDSNEPSAVTDWNGNYVISGLQESTYIVRTAGLPLGAIPTFDPDGMGTANVASIALSAGQIRTDVDWGYQFPTLSITKISDAASSVFPGDTINYTLTIRNNTTNRQTGITVSDQVPVGTSFLSGSVDGYKPFEYLDNFNTGGGYNQTAGASDWSVGGTNPWTENGDDNRATGGTIRITNNELRLRNAGGDSIQRFIPGNLAGQTVTLEIDYRENGTLESTDIAYVEMWNGTNWTPIITLVNDFGNPAAQVVDISAFAWNGDTQIRIRSTYNGSGGNEDFLVDYVRVYYTANVLGGTIHPPSDILIALDNFVLDPGQEMTVVYQVQVDDVITGGQTSVDNLVSVTSAQQPTPQTGTHSDFFALGSLGDWVWYDLDDNGIQDTGEPGVSGVIMHLFDPGPDGNIGGGDDVLMETVITDSSGHYMFENKVVDTYFVQVDLPTGYNFAAQGAGSDNSVDSDVDTSTGISTLFTLLENNLDTSVDAGLTNSQLDFGDLPSTYDSTILGADGARHLVGSLHLGPTVDTDPEGQESPNAGRLNNGDDHDGNNDDDGVTRNMSDHWLNNAIVNLFIDLQGSTSSGTADVGIWLDWNNDGDFKDDGEFFSFPNLPVGAQSTVQITIPDVGVYTVGSPVNVRVRAFDPDNLRLDSLAATNYLGFADNGEVEDYQWDFEAPTAVTLQSLNAHTQPVRFPWVLFMLMGGLSVGVWGLLKRRRDDAQFQ